MLFQKLLGTRAKKDIQYIGGKAVAYAGTTSDIAVSLTGLTGGLATQPAAGDFVIVYFGTASTADRNLVVSGYTEVVELYSLDTTSTNFVIAYKFMGSTPDTSVTLTGGTLNSLDAGTVAVQVWRNVDTSSPFDVAGLSSSASLASSTFPSITPTTLGAVILAGSASGHGIGVRTYSNSSLTGFISIGSDDTYDSTIGVGYHYWTSGAFTPANSVFSGTDSLAYSNASYVTALRPA